MGYNPSYKWTNPTYPIYNWGYNPLTIRGMSHVKVVKGLGDKGHQNLAKKKIGVPTSYGCPFPTAWLMKIEGFEETPFRTGKSRKVAPEGLP